MAELGFEPRLVILQSPYFAALLYAVSQFSKVPSSCCNLTLWFLVGITIKQSFMRLYVFQSYRYLANFKSINQPLSKTQKDYKLHEDRQACCSQMPHRQNAARAVGVILDHVSSSLWNGNIRMDLGYTSKEWAPLEWSLLGSSAVGSSLQELFKNELSKLFQDQSW